MAAVSVRARFRIGGFGLLLAALGGEACGGSAVAIADKDVPDASSGRSCASDAQCPASSVCVDGECRTSASGSHRATFRAVSSPLRSSLFADTRFEASETDPRTAQRYDDGTCSVVEYLDPLPSADAAAAVNLAHVSVQATTTLELKPGSVVTEGGSLWTPGERVEFEIDGARGEVPSFATQLIGPSYLDPVWFDLAWGKGIERTRPLMVSWQAASQPGKVTFELVAAPMVLSCLWDSETGGGSVPAEALARMPPGPAALALTAEESNDSQVGDWAIRTELAAAAEHASEICLVDVCEGDACWQSGITMRACSAWQPAPESSACPAHELTPVQNLMLADFEGSMVPNFFAYNDALGEQFGPELVPISDGAPGSAQALHTWGHGMTGWGGGITRSAPAACTATFSVDGIAFWIRSQTPIFFGLIQPETEGVEYGGDCTQSCFDRYGYTIPASPAWQHVALRWTDLSQQGFGPTPFGAAVTGFVWSYDRTDGASFDYWLDDVEFFRGDPPSGAVRIAAER